MKYPVRDFSNRKYFPGESGNPFDILLHKFEKIENIHSIIFLSLLFLLAFISAHFSIEHTLVYLAFMLGDWLLIYFLPKFHKSYGPSKPPTLFLAICRMLVGIFPFSLALILNGCATMAVFYGFYYEPFRLKISHQKLYTHKLPPGKTIRLIHFGDLHIERITNRELELIEQVRTIDPDLILFSGDILNLSFLTDSQTQLDAISVFQKLTAPYGVFYVSGSSAVDCPEIFRQLIPNLPGKWLDNQRITLKGIPLDIIGITCTHRPHVDTIVLQNLMEKNKSDNLHILLYHSPDLAPLACQKGIDLQLSGHTHGGQVRLPFYGAIFAGSLYGKRFESGRYQLADMTLYVTRGIGMEGAAAPRVRFLCPPEITVWEIHGTDSNIK
jgi:predicted MPP superfamily phosphohydrolase